MPSDPDFVAYAVDQMAGAGVITSRAMFGGHTVYCGGKVVALICDNQLFVKPTTAGREFIGAVVEAPPYPGARPFFLVGEQLDDREWLGELVRRSEKELPAPKPRKTKAKRQGGGKAKRGGGA
ncbi:MAG: competence protein TfoX [Planctomycetota bacterium]|nr:MAG: competence protein TfoX [Planctomycetota bacterium]